MKSKEIDKKYENARKERLAKIKEEPNKWKRFWKYIWFALTYVWVWCWQELRDWRTFLVFVITMLVIGSEVWVPLILGLIFNNTGLLAFAGTMEAFWLLPGTPFIAICIAITIGIKALIDKNKKKKENNEKWKKIKEIAYRVKKSQMWTQLKTISQP